MAFKGIVAAGAMALSLALAVGVAPAPAEAKTKIVIGIGGGYGYGGCWDGPFYVCGWRHPRPRYVVPRHYYYDDYPQNYGRISCGRAKNVVQNHGFNRIVTRDCAGSTYSFKARKNGHNFVVRVSARNGRITSVTRL